MCYYKRLSGGQHGFGDICTYREASLIAKELNCFSESTTYVEYRFGKNVFSVSFFDENNEELLNWSKDMQCVQLFDPPRKVKDLYLNDVYL